MKVVSLYFVIQRGEQWVYNKMLFCIVARKAQADGGVMGNFSHLYEELHICFNRLECGTSRKLLQQ